jgi:hypothetical protein
MLLCMRLIEGHWPPRLQLVVCIAAGLPVFCAISAALNRDIASELLRAVQKRSSHR